MRAAIYAAVAVLAGAGCTACGRSDVLWLEDYMDLTAIMAGGGGESVCASPRPGVWPDEFARLAFNRLRWAPESLKCHWLNDELLMPRHEHSLRERDAWAIVAADILNIPHYFCTIDDAAARDAEIARLLTVVADKASGRSRYLEDFVEWGGGGPVDSDYRVTRVVLRETVCLERFRQIAVTRLREEPESLKTASPVVPESYVRARDLWAAALARLEGIAFEISGEESERDARIESLLSQLSGLPQKRQ